MHLYNLTLQRAGIVNASVFGNFTAPKQQEIVVSHGHALDLLRPDENGKLQTIASTDVFGLVRSLLAFRLFGTDRDYLVIASDSGRLSIVEWDKDGSKWKRVHLETYGKSGMRRITPGQFLAADPKGRAIMVAAIEKQKLVYVMNRTATEPLTISSPLEAHRGGSLVWDVVGCDVGLDNPVFAALELEYADADSDPSGEAVASSEKTLVYYELDLGLNSMTRKWSRATDRGANMLVPVPGGADGPGGVLVCAENWVLYEHSSQPPLRTPLPRRSDMPDDRGLLIVAKAVHRQKGGGFFALLQSELGDVYKVTLTTVPGPDPASAPRVTDVVVSLFDTLPPAAGLVITRTGLLFSASEFGNHLLYQFTGTGEDHGAADASGGGSGTAAHSIALDGVGADGGEVEVVCPSFEPRTLANLAKLDELPSLAPLTDMKVIPAAAGAGASAGGASGPQILALCGRGPRSTLRLLREGLAVSELAVSPMPGAPMGVFTLRAPHGPAEEGHRHIVISFTNATLVLAVGEGGVEEVPARDIGFTEASPTLAATLLEDGSLLQVHAGGMRLTKAKKTVAWPAPGRRSVVHAAVNGRQVALGLSGGDVHYFELDEGGSGNLEERGKKSLGAEVTAMALGAPPPGRLRTPHLAVADSNNMVRLLSCDPASVLTQVSAQALRASAQALAIASLRVHAGAPASPHLFIGLSNGILTRVALDGSTGQLSDPRSRFAGVRPVRLAPVTVSGGPAVLALSTRPWLHYNHHGAYHGSPLAYDALEAAAPFSTPAVPEGIVAVAGNTLRIFSLDRLGEDMNARALPLRYTPRRLALHPTNGRFAAVIEADYDCVPAAQRGAAPAPPTSDGAAAAASSAAAAGSSDVDMATGGDEDDGDAMEVDDAGAGAASGSSSSAAAGVAAALPAPGSASASAASSAASSSSGLAPCAPSDIPRHSESTHGEAVAPSEEALAAGITTVDPLAEGSVDVRRVGPPLPPTPGGAAWGSCIRVVDVAALGAASEASLTRLHVPEVTHHLFDLPPGAGALCATAATFHDHPADAFLVVGVADRLAYHPRSASGGALHVYRFLEVDVPHDSEGRELPLGSSGPGVASSRRLMRLQFLHATPVSEPPTALACLAGRLAVGLGTTLRLYDLGRKRLLRKAEQRGFPSGITALTPSGVDRLFVGDASESVHAVKYRRGENALSLFADDVVPRHVTSLALLDPDTVAVGDKFGNVAVLRIPEDVSDDVGAEGSGGAAGASRLLWDAAALNGAPHKLATVAQFYVGEAVTSLQRAPMGSGQEVLLYSTISGSLGGLLPLTSREDSDFFKHLEMFLRSEDPGDAAASSNGSTVSLVGRDHMSFRSTFMPVKDVVDGDLCEVFASLPLPRQRALAEELDRTPHDVLKKLEDVRHKML